MNPLGGRYCECTRTLRLVKAMPSKLASSRLRFVLPRHVKIEPEPASEIYWDEVRLILEATPARLHVVSESYAQLKEKLIPALPSQPARAFATTVAIKLLILALLDAPRARLGVPESFNMAIAGLVDNLSGYFRQNLDVAQRVLDSLVEAMSTWELSDHISLAIQKLRLPFIAHRVGLGDGLLMVGCMADKEFRIAYYKRRLPPDFQCLRASDFNARTRQVRDDPQQVVALLKRLDLGQVGRAFGREVFGEDGHVDSGRMALAFCCKNFVQIWNIMGWPKSWDIQMRLVGLMGWHVKMEDLDDVLTRHLR